MPPFQSSNPFRQLAMGIWSVAALATAVLISRRLSGAISAPISPWMGVLWTMVLAALCAGAAWLFRQSGTQDFMVSAPRRYAEEWISALIAVTAMLAVLPLWNAVFVGVFCGLGLIAATGYGVVSLDLDRLRRVRDTVDVPQNIPADHAARYESPVAPVGVDTVEPEELPTQTQVRHSEFGADRIEGTVHVHFAEGQRDLILHLAFCPALSQIPEVEVEDLDGNDWDVKVSAVYAYGLRLVVRRDLNGPAEGDIGYSAVATASRAVA